MLKLFLKHILVFLLSSNPFSLAAMHSIELLHETDKSSLHMACNIGDLNTVTKIFSRQDLNPYTLLFLTDINGYLPIDKAVENNHVPIIKFLLNINEEYNTNPSLLIFHKNHKNGGTPLHNAIRNGQIKAGETLIEAAKKYNCLPTFLFKEQLGHLTTLHLSVLCGYHEITRMLLMQASKFAFTLASTYNNPFFQDEITPIHDAIRKEDANTLKVFIETLGIRALDIQNKNGIAALEYAKNLNSAAINAIIYIYQTK